MLITESHVDVTTSADGKDGSMSEYLQMSNFSPMRTHTYSWTSIGIYVFHPSIPGYPNA
jgi:hypothetical protein